MRFFVSMELMIFVFQGCSSNEIQYCYYKDKMEILYVSNDFDEEGGSILQLHCGNGDYDMSKMQLVRLETIFKIDNTLSSLCLEVGEEAVRESVSSEWTIKRQ